MAGILLVATAVTFVLCPACTLGATTVTPPGGATAAATRAVTAAASKAQAETLAMEAANDAAEAVVTATTAADTATMMAALTAATVRWKEEAKAYDQAVTLEAEASLLTETAAREATQERERLLAEAAAVCTDAAQAIAATRLLQIQELTRALVVALATVATTETALGVATESTATAEAALDSEATTITEVTAALENTTDTLTETRRTIRWLSLLLETNPVHTTTTTTTTGTESTTPTTEDVVKHPEMLT